MPKFKVRVTDGNSFGDFHITSDSLVDACGHAIDGVQSLDLIMDQMFEGDFDNVYVEQVSLDDEQLDVPEQFIHWKDQTIADLQREVSRLKYKCGELP